MVGCMKQKDNIKYQNFEGEYMDSKLNNCTRYLNIELAMKNKKNLPKLYENKDECCGCMACYSICPTSAIIMKPDEEGFLYPVIDASLCVRCYKCMLVCGFKKIASDRVRPSR